MGNSNTKSGRKGHNKSASSALAPIHIDSPTPPKLAKGTTLAGDAPQPPIPQLRGLVRVPARKKPSKPSPETLGKRGVGSASSSRRRKRGEAHTSKVVILGPRAGSDATSAAAAPSPTPAPGAESPTGAGGGGAGDIRLPQEQQQQRQQREGQNASRGEGGGHVMEQKVAMCDDSDINTKSKHSLQPYKPQRLRKRHTNRCTKRRGGECNCGASWTQAATLVITTAITPKDMAAPMKTKIIHAVVASGVKVYVGSSRSADVRLPASEGVQSRHMAFTVVDQDTVNVGASAKAYALVGQGGTAQSGSQPLVARQIIKLGACSLAVVTIQTESDFPPVNTPTGLGGDAPPAAPGCYICWDNSTGPGLKQVIPMPCACNKHVHRECLGKWLKERPNRDCEVCSSPMPYGVAAAPPYIVLRVVRHMKNLVWSGRKEFVLSFADRKGQGSAVVMGSEVGCEVHLPDPSVSRRHAQVVFQCGSFVVEDLSSSGGTFVRATSSVLSLATAHALTWRIGRATVSIDLLPPRRPKHREGKPMAARLLGNGPLGSVPRPLGPPGVACRGSAGGKLRGYVVPALPSGAMAGVATAATTAPPAAAGVVVVGNDGDCEDDDVKTEEIVVDVHGGGGDRGDDGRQECVRMHMAPTLPPTLLHHTVQAVHQRPPLVAVRDVALVPDPGDAPII